MGKNETVMSSTQGIIYKDSRGETNKALQDEYIEAVEKGFIGTMEEFLSVRDQT